MYLRYVATLGAFALVLNLAFTETLQKADDAKNIQGTWKIVSIAGGPGKGGPTAEELKDARMKVSANELVMIAKGKEEPVTYKLDPSKKPKTIDLTHKRKTGEEETIPGIYELNGDDLKICLAIATRPARKDDKDKSEPFRLTRPTEFKASEKSGVMVFQREK